MAGYGVKYSEEGDDTMVSFAFLTLLVCIFLIIKNENAEYNRIIIFDAINYYKKDMQTIYKNVYEVDFEDMESYEKTLFRLWDWGYKNILPPDKFKIIKPYIYKGRK